MTKEEFIKKWMNLWWLPCIQKSFVKDVDLLISSEIEVSAREMFLNMQYYMEYCQMNGYVTPQEWIEKHKHF